MNSEICVASFFMSKQKNVSIFSKRKFWIKKSPGHVVWFKKSLMNRKHKEAFEKR